MPARIRDAPLYAISAPRRRKVPHAGYAAVQDDKPQASALGDMPSVTYPRSRGVDTVACRRSRSGRLEDGIQWARQDCEFCMRKAKRIF